ncbi:Polo-like kinase [Aureococcus anophagefferens]|uniref:Polo-like kinase n=1 Tax=Aureococcus anophagefferens TaxID=44056 RepID=A0ABR1FSF8_AURAN
MEAYDVGAYLGRGGFATVFRAIERSSGRTVALKVVDMAALEAAGVSASRLDREVALHAPLRHARVVECYGAFETSSPPGAAFAGDDEAPGGRYTVLVLEYCGGGDLRALVRRLGRLEEPAAAALLRQVLEGVAYLHAAGVAHRDLKLSNVLLGEGGAKICDFGVACATGAGECRTLCGTPDYIAPEVVARREPQTESVDLWSLGPRRRGRPWRTAALRRPSTRRTSTGRRARRGGGVRARPPARAPGDRPSAREALDSAFLRAAGTWATRPFAGWERDAALGAAARVARRQRPAPLALGARAFRCATRRQRIAVADGFATLECAGPRGGAARLKVSGDGLRCAVSARARRRRAVARCGLGDLPEAYWPLYAHLARAVALAKSRARKVVVVFDSARAARPSRRARDERAPGGRAPRLVLGGRRALLLATGRFEVRRGGAVAASEPAAPGAALPAAPGGDLERRLRDAQRGVRRCLRAEQARAAGPFPVVVDLRAAAAPTAGARRRPWRRAARASPVCVARAPTGATPRKAAPSARSASSRTTAQPGASLSFVSDLTGATAPLGARPPRSPRPLF